MKRRLIALFTILLSVSLIATYSCKKEKDKSVAVTEVRLNKASVTLVEGDTDELMATVMPENATDKGIEWTSNNESVATVSPTGLVTAIKDGKATITVKTNDGGFTATCAVTVNKKIIAVSKVELNKIELTLDEGKEEKLVVTVKPDDATDKSVVWESSNENVVTVDQEGLVKAVRDGDAQITVTAKNGVSASCIVGVSKKDIPVTGITVIPSSLLLPARNTYVLKAQVQPSNATDQNVKWGSSNNDVAAVSETGRVTTKNAGTADIMAMLNGKFAKCTVKVDNVTISMNKSSYNILSNTKKINIKSDIAANFELDYSKFSFSSSDKDVATIDSNFYIATHGKKGTTNVAVIYRYGNGELKTGFTITVK